MNLAPTLLVPELQTLRAHIEGGFFEDSDLALLEALVGCGQAHLFSDWHPLGESDDEKREFLAMLRTAHESYPGGIPAYVKNARRLLADAAEGKNPFEGCVPHRPDMVDLSQFGEDYTAAEAVGFQAFAETAVVLVAGGLGERLGYSGIKLGIPLELLQRTSYLAHYAAVIREASRRHARPIPLIIMTSRDTHEGTVAMLAEHENFGLEPTQITILRQELVPAVADMDARLALDAPYRLLMKPHGHGDIHMLLHTSGTARRLAEAGVRYLLFIQDTNAQVFNAAFAAIGVSEQQGYDFNSIAVNRIPGEAVGGLARLSREGKPDLTLNIEYNQLDPLLRATISPEGDVPDEHGHSCFPGNINLLVVRLAPYLRVLDATQGIIAEFINPKFSDSTRTAFKKPARLETMMQDLPKLFDGGEKVGVTVFDRVWCFSACKNNLADAAAKVRQGGPPESASSAEHDFYHAGRMKLIHAGVSITDEPVREIQGIPFTPGPRVIVRPSTALTLADLEGRFQNVTLSGSSTLILDGDVRLENVHLSLSGTLIVKAPPGSSLTVRNLQLWDPGFLTLPLTDEEMADPTTPEYLRIRGYSITSEGAVVLEPPSKPGSYVWDSVITSS